jgi:hypothetical protein
MVKVTREGRLDGKGASTYQFDVVLDRELDRAVYETGVQCENARFEDGSFAQQIFTQFLSPHTPPLDPEPAIATVRRA